MEKKFVEGQDKPYYVLRATKNGETSKGGAETNFTIETKDGVKIADLKFQDKPVQEGMNGVTNEILLQVVVDRLADFQAGPFACQDNAEALTYIKKAIEALSRRHEDRISRDAYGKYIK